MSETEHSPKFSMVKGFYDRGLWSKRMVRDAVTHPANGTPWITKNEYKEIIGEDYAD